MYSSLPSLDLCALSKHRVPRCVLFSRTCAGKCEEQQPRRVAQCHYRNNTGDLSRQKKRKRCSDLYFLSAMSHQVYCCRRRQSWSVVELMWRHLWWPTPRLRAPGSGLFVLCYWIQEHTCVSLAVTLHTSCCFLLSVVFVHLQ